MTDTAEKTGAALPQPMRPNLSWPAIIGVLGFVLPLLRPANLLIDPDTYLHIAAGRWMIEHQALPFQDPFSNSVPGAAWVPHEWLAELVFAALYAVGGWGAPVVLCAACFGLSLGLFARRLMIHCESFSLTIMVMLTGWLAYSHLLVRPHALAFPILVAWAAGLIAARDRNAPPPLWLLPLMVLWANLHGGFMVGNALVLYLGGEAVLPAGDAAARRRALRQWGLFLVLSLLAGLMTPNGVAGFVQPFRLMNMPTLQTRFSEWLSPNLRTDRLLELWVLGAPLLAFGLGLRLPIFRLILLTGLYYETFQSSRHADLLCWVGPLAVAASLGPQLAGWIRLEQPSALARWMMRRMAPGNVAGALCVVPLLLLAGAVTIALPPVPEAKLDCPQAALAAVRAQHIEGPVLNTEMVGGCLIFNGVPPFIDGRIEMYGDAFLARWSEAAEGRVAALQGVLADYHIAWTLFPPSSGAAQVLDLLPGWRRAYSDADYVIHVRTDPTAAKE